METITPPIASTGPVLRLSWKRPLEVNGILLKYKLEYNNSYTGKRFTVDIPPGTNTSSLQALGGTTYFFFLRAVTIKEGPAVSLGPVTIPEYSEYCSN